MSRHHDEALEGVFWRRRMGRAALRQIEAKCLPVTGAVVRFPVAIRLGVGGPDDPGAGLYPMIDLDHEPGTAFPEGHTKVCYRLVSPTPGMRFEAIGWFWVSVGAPAGEAPAAGFEEMSGKIPAGCERGLPGNLALAACSGSALRRDLRRVVRDGDAAWEQEFFAAVKPMLYRIVGEQLAHRHPLHIESSDEWGRAMETAVKGGLMFSSPERTAVSWTNWANRNIRRDVTRERDRRSGRSYADQSVRRFAMTRMPTASDAELHAAADDLYDAWRVETAWRTALVDEPDLGLDEFAERLGGELPENPTFGRERFRRALEPMPSVVPLHLVRDDTSGLAVELQADPADELVEVVASFHDEPEAAADQVRRWLVRRGALDATDEAEERAARAESLERLEARVFGPWEGEGLRWSRRSDRQAIRRRVANTLSA